jgi:hypothetical protein
MIKNTEYTVEGSQTFIAHKNGNHLPRFLSMLFKWDF